VALAVIAALSLPAAAAPKSKRAEAAQSKKKEAKLPFGEMPKGPLQLVVSIADQRVTLYSNGVHVAQARVSTGTPDRPTPTGVFSIIQKDRWHRSNLYGAAPMYFMQRLTWSGVAMHEGMLPGYAASHGCIRMPTDFASRLWLVTRLGVRVVVARHDVVPHDIDHAKLFMPKLKPVEPPVAETQFEKRAAAPAPVQLAWATPANDGNSTSDVSPDTGLRRSVIETPAPAEGAEPVDSAGVQPPPPAAPPEDQAEVAKPADDEPTVTTAAPAPEAAPSQAAEAAPAADEPGKPLDNDLPLRKPIPLLTRTAEPQKRTGQVAVFVSRKEKKIFVRQGFIPVFDMAVEIDNPAQPLGTHVFTAMAFQDNGARMRWNAISMPAELPRSIDHTVRGKSGRQAPKQAPVVASGPASNASQALDRIHIPQQARDRIGELLIPGSSLVVSDEGLGRETGLYTDFIVLTR